MPGTTEAAACGSERPTIADAACSNTPQISVYDVTRRETFEDLERIWMKEVDIYSNIEDAVKMVVANKVDLVRRG